MKAVNLPLLLLEIGHVAYHTYAHAHAISVRADQSKAPRSTPGTCLVSEEDRAKQGDAAGGGALKQFWGLLIQSLQ